MLKELAFDTLYAEAQRRYVESLSSYARHFLGVMQNPDVDAIAVTIHLRSGILYGIASFNLSPWQ